MKYTGLKCIILMCLVFVPIPLKAQLIENENPYIIYEIKVKSTKNNTAIQDVDLELYVQVGGKDSIIYQRNKKDTNQFILKLLPDNHYKLYLSSDDYLPYSTILKTDSCSSICIIERQIHLAPMTCPGNMVYHLPDISFNKNSSILTSQAKENLKVFLEVLNVNKEIKYEIISCLATNEKNTIGKKRINKVYQYFIDNGISQNRLSRNYSTQNYPVNEGQVRIMIED